MHDFAYLFRDSVASWLDGRGDARFHSYEKFYRSSRAAAIDGRQFDLEASNDRYATTCTQGRSRVMAILESRAFKHVALSITLLWIGSSLLPIVGHSEPFATGAVLVGVFMLLRVKKWRGRSRRA